jgi:CelD/BcsL family acetyltransferase involved in cellulose biosynthesis
MKQGETHNSPGAAGGGVQVDVFESFDELAPMQQEWDDFVEAVGAEIFLTYDWCRIWWKYYGKNRDLAVFVFRSNGRLAGVIPLFFEKIWLGPVYIQAAKIVGTDFTICTTSLPVQPRFLEPVVREFLGKLSSDYGWDVAHIGPLSGIYETEPVVRALDRSVGKSHVLRQTCTGFQAYVGLAASWDDFLSQLGRSTRRGIKRSYRNLAMLTPGADRLLRSDFALLENYERVFEAFVCLHQKHWGKLGKLGHFGDWPWAREFHHEVVKAQLKHNRLRLLEVKLDCRTLGFIYAYRFHNAYYAFLNARTSLDEMLGAQPNTASIGTVVLCEQIRKAIDEGVGYIDMMPGQDEYKLHMGGELFPVESIYIYPKKICVLVRVYLFRVLAWFLNMCYYRLWYCRIAPKLPFKRRPLWKIWIRTHAFG